MGTGATEVPSGSSALKKDNYIPIREGDRWRCIRCGTCCHLHFEDRWLHYIGVTLDVNEVEGRCPKLGTVGDVNYCTIHSSRPNACRAFPFTLRKNDRGSYYLAIHKKCKGLGKGRAINIKRKVQEVVRHSNREYGRRTRAVFDPSRPGEVEVRRTVARPRSRRPSRT